MAIKSATPENSPRKSSPTSATSSARGASAKPLKIIGNNALITIAGIKNIPAKVDTGADSSSVWATGIHINASKQLVFRLLGPSSPLYTGEEIIVDDFQVRQVRNSTGDVSIRYRVTLPAIICGKRIRANFTLSDRSRNKFPVLIGRKTLQNKFLVDVSRVSVKRPPTMNNANLADELRCDPHTFHCRYMQDDCQ